MRRKKFQRNLSDLVGSLWKMKKNNQKCSIFNWHFLILTGLVNILVCKSVFEMEFSLAGMIQRPMCQMNKTIWIMKWTIMLRFLWHLFHVREGCRKKNPEKVWSFAKPGGGVSEGKQKTKPQVWKCVFSVSIENHSGTPKTCFTLGLECLGHF